MNLNTDELKTTEPYENTAYVWGRVNDGIQEYASFSDKGIKFVYNELYATRFQLFANAVEALHKARDIFGSVPQVRLLTVKITTQITKVFDTDYCAK